MQGILTVQSHIRDVAGRRAPSRRDVWAGRGHAAVLRRHAGSIRPRLRLGMPVAFCLLMLLAMPVRSRAEPSAVTWAIYDAPPFMIGSGPDAGNGIFDQIRQLLDAHLPELSAHTLQAPFPRVLASLRDGAELCFIGGVETPERDAYAAFSLPVAMFYPLRIAVHTPERKRFEARGPLSLPGLLADPSLRTSFLKNRSLGPRIDEIVQQVGSVHTYSEFGEAFRMLLADRLDYLVEYSSISHFQAARLGEADGIAELPFAEAPEPVFSRVMCPATDWGRSIIAKVNAVLRVERATPAYRRIVEAWTAEEDLAKVREVYDRAFLDAP